MKLKGRRQSKNVEIRTGESSGPLSRKGNPRKNPAYIRYDHERRQAYKDEGDKTVAKTMADKDHFARPMLKAMDKQYKEANRRPARTEKTPVPTPLPTPDKNYRHPKLWRY